MTFFDNMRGQILANMKEQGWKNSDKFLNTLPLIIQDAEKNIYKELDLLKYSTETGG